MQETAPKHPMSKPFEYSLVCMIPRTLPTWNSSFCNTASGLQEQIFSQQFSGAWNFFSGISFLGFELLPASINRSQLHLHTPLSICTYWFKSRTFGGKEKVLKFWVKETHRHTHTHTLTDTNHPGRRIQKSGQSPQSQTEPVFSGYSASWSLFWTSIFIVKSFFFFNGQQTDFIFKGSWTVSLLCLKYWCSINPRLKVLMWHNGSLKSYLWVFPDGPVA